MSRSAAALAHATEDVATTDATGAARADLRVLRPAPFRAPRGPFVLAIGAVLTLGLLGVLMLNTVVTQDAFKVSALQTQSATLADEEQALTQQVATADSPQHLDERARALGMVPSVNPVFLRLSDGKVLGDPVAGEAVRRPAAPGVGGPATGTSKTAKTHVSAGATPSPGATTAPVSSTGTKASAHPGAILKTKAAKAIRTKAAKAKGTR